MRWFLGPRKLFAALAVSGVLDVMEWKEHHPPFIAVVCLLHLVVVWLVIVAVVFIGQFSRSRKSAQ